MLLGIFDQVPDHPSQQCRVAADDDRLARDIALRATRALLRGERQQIHLFADLELPYGVETAREQDLLDQRVDFGDVLFQIGPALRVSDLFEQLSRQAKARQRRSELMRNIGEQQLVRSDQLLDLCRGPVEALRQARDLVAALDFYPRRQVA